jgi:hypothetical protein
MSFGAVRSGNTSQRERQVLVYLPEGALIDPLSRSPFPSHRAPQKRRKNGPMGIFRFSKEFANLYHRISEDAN